MKHRSLLCALVLVCLWPLHVQAEGLVLSAGPLASVGSTPAGRQVGFGLESTIIYPGSDGLAGGGFIQAQSLSLNGYRVAIGGQASLFNLLGFELGLAYRGQHAGLASGPSVHFAPFLAAPLPVWHVSTLGGEIIPTLSAAVRFNAPLQSEGGQSARDTVEGVFTIKLTWFKDHSDVLPRGLGAFR